MKTTSIQIEEEANSLFDGLPEGAAWAAFVVEKGADVTSQLDMCVYSIERNRVGVDDIYANTWSGDKYTYCIAFTTDGVDQEVARDGMFSVKEGLDKPSFDAGWKAARMCK